MTVFTAFLANRENVGKERKGRNIGKERKWELNSFPLYDTISKLLRSTVLSKLTKYLFLYDALARSTLSAMVLKPIAQIF